MTFQLDADGSQAPGKVSADRYAEGILSHRLPTEMRRLQVMERMLDPDEMASLAGLGIEPTWHCLELGAGAGSIARWLAEQCPQGRVVAADVDTSFLDQSRSSNLHVVRQDVERGEFPPASFDLIHARALFMHLADRDALLGRAVRWLKPGGWLAVSEADMFPVDSTPHPAIGKMWTAAEQLFRSQGSDPRWARRLPLLLGRAGLVDIGMSVKVDILGGGGVTDEFWRSSFAQVKPFLLERGLVDESVYDEAHALVDDPNFRDTLWAYVRAWGRRPRD
ncbi:class I SAM-dependent methyltransferase [Micromonospora sp. PLK6-60]|uniref:class I SAM-dependent methyltransferase n=1 Tax=Micromonospora sp. PLK6-60 TaxID=2873383 RepID=UPI001CA6E7DF|nr:class I SAM-dependent methyltransferase [Micromonospora sp. PLK6-60]MBY8870802.1 class I SAM-dependent methyltransferase [Micromonospora sp. PLK6-60]